MYLGILAVLPRSLRRENREKWLYTGENSVMGCEHGGGLTTPLSSWIQYLMCLQGTALSGHSLAKTPLHHCGSPACRGCQKVCFSAVRFSCQEEPQAVAIHKSRVSQGKFSKEKNKLIGFVG